MVVCGNLFCQVDFVLYSTFNKTLIVYNIRPTLYLPVAVKGGGCLPSFPTNDFPFRFV